MTSKSKKKGRKTSRQKMEQCAGCDNWFTINGYFHHLCQTQKPDCITVRKANKRYHPSHSNLDSASPTPSTSPTPSSPSLDDDNGNALGASADPQVFQGNYFGNYAPTEFKEYDEYDGAADIEGGDEEVEHEPDHDGFGWEDGEDSGAEEDAEEEEDALNYQEEGSWEPPTQGDEDVGADMEEDTFNASDETTPSSDVRAAQQRTQERLHAKTFIV